MRGADLRVTRYCLHRCEGCCQPAWRRANPGCTPVQVILRGCLRGCDMRAVSRHLTPSLAVSAIALVVAAGSGAAVASPGILIGTRQIKNGAVTTAKLHDQAVTPGKLAALGPYHRVGTSAVPFENGWMNDSVLT